MDARLIDRMMSARNRKNTAPMYVAIDSKRRRALEVCLDWPGAPSLTNRVNCADAIDGVKRSVLLASVLVLPSTYPAYEWVLQRRPDAFTVICSNSNNVLHSYADSPVNFGQASRVVAAVIKRHPQLLMMKNGDGRLPLHMAAANPSDTVARLRMYLEACPGAAMAPDATGRLPLHVAVKVASMNPSTPSTPGATTSSETDMQPSIRSAIEAVMLIYTYHPDAIKARDAKGRTPIHEASRLNQSFVLRTLLRLWPAGVSAHDCEGQTPWFWALGSADFKGMLAVLNAAEPKGYLTSELSGGGTLLHVAASWNQVEVLEHLLERYPGIRMVNARGRTPLYSAVKSGALEACRYLMKKFPKLVNLRDRFGRSLIDVAKMYHKEAVLTELLLHEETWANPRKRKREHDEVDDLKKARNL